jgi:hypothetical protein
MTSHKKNSPVEKHKSKHRRSREKCKSKEHHESREKCKSKEYRKSRESREKCKRSRNERKTRKSKSHDSSSSDEEEDFEEIYCKLKNMLIHDKELMVRGCTSYLNGYSTAPRILQTNGIVAFDYIDLKNHLDYPYTNAPFFVCEDGYYSILFCANSAQSTQFTVFLNGTPQPLSISGNNAGSGQSVFNFFIFLKKNDAIEIRNYKSETSSLNISAQVGGTENNCNLNICVVKVSPLEVYKMDRKKCEFSTKEKCLFKELEHKLLCDPCLQMRGYNVHGVFSNSTIQTVALEAPVIFTNGNNINGLTPMDGTGTYSQVRIDEEGVYRVEFLCTTDTSSQFAVFLNGVVDQASIFGTNKGAGQLLLRHLMKLNKGDMLSINNHTSGGPIVLSQNAGGSLPGISALLEIVKIAPLKQCAPYENKHNECIEKMYCNFKKYLLMNHHLELEGSEAFLSTFTSTPQTLQVGDKIVMSVIDTIRNVDFTQGTSDIRIKHSGDYEIRADIISDRPSQFTLFVNNVAVPYSTTGRDSGANRNIIRQIITLKHGDCLDIRNWKSNLGQIATTQNSGGTYVDANVNFTIMKLSNVCEKYHKFK